MANQTDRQIILDGPRNAIVKFTGVLTDTDAWFSPALRITDFSATEAGANLSGFRVDLVEFAISQPLEVVLAWTGATPQIIVPLSGRGRLNSWNYGGLQPDTTKPGYDGSITLYTQNFPPGSIMNYTVLLELVKLYSR